MQSSSNNRDLSKITWLARPYEAITNGLGFSSPRPQFSAVTKQLLHIIRKTLFYIFSENALCSSTVRALDCESGDLGSNPSMGTIWQSCINRVPVIPINDGEVSCRCVLKALTAIRQVLNDGWEIRSSKRNAGTVRSIWDCRLIWKVACSMGPSADMRRWICRFDSYPFQQL